MTSFLSLMHFVTSFTASSVWRLQNSTQKRKKWFTGLRKTAGLQSLCSSPDQTGSRRMTVRTAWPPPPSSTASPFVSYKKESSLIPLDRCGFVLGDQQQPRPVMLPPDPGWQNVQRSGSSIRWCQVAEGHARIFHPTCIVCWDVEPPPQNKGVTIFWKCLPDSYLIPHFLLLWFIDIAWIVHVYTIKLSLWCHSHFCWDVIAPHWTLPTPFIMFYHQWQMLQGNYEILSTIMIFSKGR